MNSIQKARAWAERVRHREGAQVPRVFSPPYGGAAYFGQAYRWEQVLHYKYWTFVAIGATIREVAGSASPNIGRVYTRDEKGKGKKWGRKAKAAFYSRINKALGGPKDHQEFEPYDDEHPLVRLFRRPNEHYVAYDLWAYHMLFKGLCGQVHWWVMRNGFGVPVEIWIIPTHWMRLETDRYGRPLSYAVQSPWGQLQHVPYDQVVSFYDQSPLNMYEGTAVTQAISEWIDSYESQVRARLAMFKNGGAPALHVLLGDSYADPDEAFLARFYAKWIARFQGEDNWGKPLLTGPDIEVKNIGVQPNEIPFKEGEEQGRDMILSAYGVPKGVVGLEPTSDVSAYAPQRQFVRFRINPELKYIGEVITEKIIRETPGHEDGIFFFDDHVIDDPEQMLREIQSRWDKAAISPNQIKALFGDEPWEFGGDDPVLNGAVVAWGTGRSSDPPLDERLEAALGKNPVGEYRHEDDDEAPELQSDNNDESIVAKEEEAPVGPALRWHRTPLGNLEARGQFKWKIERNTDRKGVTQYSLFQDGKKVDESGAIGIVKEVAEKKEAEPTSTVETEPVVKLSGASGASGGYLIPAEIARRYSKKAPNKPGTPDKRFTVAVDLHGTLADHQQGDGPTPIGPPLPGAREAMEKFRELGFRTVINSVLGDVQTIREWLTINNIPCDYINESPWGNDTETSGKIDADVYVDDRGMHFKGDWEKIEDKVRERYEETFKTINRKLRRKSWAKVIADAYANSDTASIEEAADWIQEYDPVAVDYGTVPPDRIYDIQAGLKWIKDILTDRLRSKNDAQDLYSSIHHAGPGQEIWNGNGHATV